MLNSICKDKVFLDLQEKEWLILPSKHKSNNFIKEEGFGRGLGTSRRHLRQRRKDTVGKAVSMCKLIGLV